MQITSRLRNDSLSLTIKETDFVGTPLLKQGELRLHKIFILNEILIAGGITNVSDSFMKTVIERLIKLMQ
jgi:hypothetical protein